MISMIILNQCFKIKRKDIKNKNMRGWNNKNKNIK
jgi:hypothetical protein